MTAASNQWPQQSQAILLTSPLSNGTSDAKGTLIGMWPQTLSMHSIVTGSITPSYWAVMCPSFLWIRQFAKERACKSFLFPIQYIEPYLLLQSRNTFQLQYSFNPFGANVSREKNPKSFSLKQTYHYLFSITTTCLLYHLPLWITDIMDGFIKMLSYFSLARSPLSFR